MQAPKKERTHKQHAASIWVVASSSARRTSLAASIARVFQSATVQVVASPGFSPSRISSSAEIVCADVDSPASAAALVEYMAEAPSETGFVGFIDNPDPLWVHAALKGGINAIISREPGLDELRLALDAAEAGMLLLHPTTARGLFFATAVPTEPIYEHERLTERESEVLRLLGEGLGNKEIAVRLAISEHTAKFHISSILGKLSVSTRTEAVSQGIRRGLIPI